MRTRLLVFLVAIALAAAATAQTKQSGVLQCAKADPMHAIEVGDRPNHSLVVAKTSCTWSKGMEMGGSQQKDGVSVASEELSNGKSNGKGVHWGSMVSGDKYFVSFQGKSTYGKDGSMESVEGTWSYTGGTGKLKGLKGKGTYKGKGGPGGTASYEVAGDYKLP
jgi:hypothetical protein